MQIKLADWLLIIIVKTRGKGDWRENFDDRWFRSKGVVVAISSWLAGGSSAPKDESLRREGQLSGL